MDEMFGGVGVVMSAFTRQLCFTNAAVFFTFLYYTFYAPISTAVPMMWQAQTILAALILAWNLIEAISVEALVIFYARFNVALYSFFSVSLMAAPSFFFGTPSPIAYWSVWGDLSLCAARGLGVGLFGFMAVGYYFHREAMCKLLTVFNVINIVLFSLPAFFGGESAVVPMWLIQLLVTVPSLVIGIYIEVIGATGPWSLAMALPKFGANVDTFNFVSLIWFVPFILGFYIDPSFFGPSTPLPFPLFLDELNETTEWFFRAWVTSMLLVVLAPYVFGLNEERSLGVAKQLTMMYLGTVVLFTYGLLTTSTMNMVMAVPTTVANTLFVAAGVYLSLPQTSGQPLL
mmetsp:Transcript_28882/g.74176  ORF Transcript_28882/g.74176 Transcript_28882/m.74176 type:complete len:344 (-) Transcript_28882:483-1514(-)